MEGLDQILRLPEEIKEKIKQEFGSEFELYQKVFDLNKEQHQLTGSGSPRLSDIENELFDIEDKLEEMRIVDGRDITSDIASDYGEILVNKRIDDLNKYLEPLGTDFNKMQQWLKNNYGI